MNLVSVSWLNHGQPFVLRDPTLLDWIEAQELEASLLWAIEKQGITGEPRDLMLSAIDARLTLFLLERRLKATLPGFDPQALASALSTPERLRAFVRELEEATIPDPFVRARGTRAPTFLTSVGRWISSRTRRNSERVPR